LERKAINRKSKGGIKSHSVINADEKRVPNLVWFSPIQRDHQFLESSNAMHTVYIFDKGYNDYKAFEHFTEQNGFCYSNKENAMLKKISF
jgi:hypothetical protein